MKRSIDWLFLIPIFTLMSGCGGGGGDSTDDRQTGSPTQQVGTLDQRIKNVDLPQEVYNHIRSSDMNQPLASNVAKHFVYLSQVRESEERSFLISLAAAQLCLEGVDSVMFDIEIAGLLSAIYPGSSGITRYISEMAQIGSYDISTDEIESIGCEVES